MNYAIDHILTDALAIIVAILGVARLTRAITYDDFPPFVWWRITWGRITNGGPWEKLFTCWWCLSFWVALVCVGWFMLTALSPILLWSWWIFWGSLSIAYVAAMIIVRDTPND